MNNSGISQEGNLLEVISLKKYFPIRAGLLKKQVGSVRAVDDVSFYIKRGETLGLVGESGCGKTTVGRSIMMLTSPTEGYAFFETPYEVVDSFKKLYNLKIGFSENGGTHEQAIKIAELADQLVSAPKCLIKEEKKKHFCTDARKLKESLIKDKHEILSTFKKQNIIELAEEVLDEVAIKYCINYKKKKEVKKIRGRIQFVFQDPFSSLDPRALIKNIIAEPLIVQSKYWKTLDMVTKKPNKKRIKKGPEIRKQVIELLEKVGLNIEHMYRYPHEFSGGQRQRIGIARALSVRPDFIVLDEPTSALDVSVQAQILNMLNDLQNDFGLTFLFISHDLSVIKYMCDRVAVMYLGKIVESAPKNELFLKPTHPYTEALLSVIPVPDPDVKKDRIILTGDVPSPANPPSGCRFHTRCSLAISKCSREEPPLIDRGNEHFVACHVR